MNLPHLQSLFIHCNEITARLLVERRLLLNVQRRTRRDVFFLGFYDRAYRRMLATLTALDPIDRAMVRSFAARFLREARRGRIANSKPEAQLAA